MTWLNLTMPNQTVRNNLKAKNIKLPQMKILPENPELWRWVIFGTKMVHLPQAIFFWKTIIILLICLLATFIVQNLKWILPVDPELNVQFLGPKWPISPNENFFRKPVHESCFFYSCLSICQKSKSDINLLVKYW